MKTKAEIIQDIFNITEKIQNEYPELLKYLEEMPNYSSEYESETVNHDNSQEYYNSLVDLVARYSRTHT